MYAAGSRYETRETNGIAHFAEHMFFKGTERRPTLARHHDRDRLDRRRVQRLHRQGVHRLLRQVRRRAARSTAFDVLVDMLRHSKFDPEEIEREKGVIVEEMNMYFDTPRDYIGGVYDSLLYGDQPLGWDIIGRKETVRAATRDTFLDYIDRWYKPERMVVGVGGRIDGDVAASSRSCSATCEPAATGDPDAGRGAGERRRPRVKSTRRRPTRRTVCIGVRSYPLDAPRPLRAPAAHDGARRRHVVAPVHRGARAARARLLRLRRQPQLHRRRLALRPGRRRHQPHRRGGRRRSSRSCEADRRGARAGRRAREGEELGEGAIRAPAREPARHDHVRPAPRGARGRSRPSRRK